MSSDVRLMWPSTYDPITDTHTLCVGKGPSKRLYRFTDAEWNDYEFMSMYKFGWSDPRASSYTYLSSTSTDEERKAMDKKIADEYDSIFGHDEEMAKAYAAKLGASMAATKDAVASAVWSTHSSPTSWDYVDYEFAKKELPMNPFLDKVVKMEYVGSRITCSPAPTDTDEDVLLLTDDLETLIGDCIEVGFTRDGAVSSTYPKEFVSLRSGTMNFIVTDKEEFFEKFMLATHVCKSLNVMSKFARITVFQAILYNNKS